MVGLAGLLWKGGWLRIMPAVTDLNRMVGSMREIHGWPFLFEYTAPSRNEFEPMEEELEAGGIKG
jgi:hypothetical protein